MAEVDANHATCLSIDHEVGEVTVSDTQQPVTDAEQRVGAGEVRAQRKEGLGRRTHLHESSSGRDGKIPVEASAYHLNHVRLQSFDLSSTEHFIFHAIQYKIKSHGN